MPFIFLPSHADACLRYYRYYAPLFRAAHFADARHFCQRRYDARHSLMIASYLPGHATPRRFAADMLMRRRRDARYAYAAAPLPLCQPRLIHAIRCDIYAALLMLILFFAPLLISLAIIAACPSLMLHRLG